MKKNLSFLLLLLASSLISAQGKKQPSFQLQGSITGSPGKFVYLLYPDSTGELMTDSCEIMNGKFHFNGNISEPVHAILKGNLRIMDDEENNNLIDFYLEPAPMTVSVRYDQFKQAVINGSRTQTEYESLKRQEKSIDIHSADAPERFSSLSRDFIVNHPDSYISAFELTVSKTRWPIDTVERLFSMLTPEIQHSVNGKEIKAVIDELNDNAPGRPAKDFTARDINDQPLNLSDFKGKYVLIDFWGSWCVPCRASFPHLLELYNKYHSKGFEVIAVDEEYTKEKAPWTDAVKKDNTGVWHNIQTGVEFNNGNTDLSHSITQLYGVHSFPTRFLVDPQGVIVGRYIGTDNESDLDLQLERIYK